ncbi:hypothetical protein V6N13_063089 [Hibiscus sabdariffa]
MERRRTATLGAHDSYDGIREAGVREVSGPDEVVESSHIELSVSVNQLSGATMVCFRHQSKPDQRFPTPEKKN